MQSLNSMILWGVGEVDDSGQKAPISSYKINKLWRCNVQHGD